MKDVDDARERLYLGLRRRVKLSQKEKIQTAYHEAGHAIVTYLLAPTKDVFKITITPRGHTGGVTWTPEREDTFIDDQNQLLNEIKICLGSFAAEKIKFGFTTGGVSGDFSTALQIAHFMVWQVGMGKSGIIGNFLAVGWKTKRYGLSELSEDMKYRLDKDVQELMQTCLQEVTELLQKETPLLDRLSQELLKKEELNYDEIEAIFKEFGKVRNTA